MEEDAKKTPSNGRQTIRRQVTFDSNPRETESSANLSSHGAPPRDQMTSTPIPTLTNQTPPVQATPSSYHQTPAVQLTPPGYQTLSNLTSPREKTLQKLLQEERDRSEQRKSNYQTLKDEHLKLQKDFLNLQSEIRTILEDAKLMSARKSSELESLKKIIQDKDASIETLKKELSMRDPILLRDKIMKELEAPIRRLEKEVELSEREKDRLNHEIKLLTCKIENQDKEMIDAIERLKLSYEVQINANKAEREELKLKIVELSQKPDVQKMALMTEENSRLKNKLTQAKERLTESEEAFKKMQSRLERLISDYDKCNVDHAQEVARYKMKIDAISEKLDKANQQVITLSRDNTE